MPFRSGAQRRYMFATHPDVARKWSNEFGGTNHSAGMKPFHPQVSGASQGLKDINQLNHLSSYLDQKKLKFPK